MGRESADDAVSPGLVGRIFYRDQFCHLFVFNFFDCEAGKSVNARRKPLASLR